ncbi:hypothetical protein QWY86_04300 [Pedobacter aquatilis]|uniref:hypothetical protein n=1 Tax=Pedobacter aquatilis TaxID=351343 RepID=UPI0025B3C3D2|nr:hypothetical protein [Pedobacter aquatilis]MDN3585875.1 hypothetical protein [Pedobacter aquatilis]
MHFLKVSPANRSNLFATGQCKPVEDQQTKSISTFIGFVKLVQFFKLRGYKGLNLAEAKRNLLNPLAEANGKEWRYLKNGNDINLYFWVIATIWLFELTN